jgi:hypothetical protein
VPEFLWRSLAGGACLGVPAYVLGSLMYSGRRVPGLLLAIVGGTCGFAFGFVILSGLAPPWPPAVAVSIVLGLVAAAAFPQIPFAQAKLRQQMTREGPRGRRR